MDQPLLAVEQKEALNKALSAAYDHTMAEFEATMNKKNKDGKDGGGVVLFITFGLAAAMMRSNAKKALLGEPFKKIGEDGDF